MNNLGRALAWLTSRKPSHVATAAILGALVLVFGWRMVTQDSASATAPVSERQPIEFSPADVTKAKLGTLNRSVRVTGSLTALNQVALKAPFSGRIDAVQVRAGDRVTKGQVLAQFNNVDLAASLRQTEGNLRSAIAQRELASKTLARYRPLAEKGYLAGTALDKAESDLRTAEGNVAALRQLVTTARKVVVDGTVRSPITGIVSERAVDPGQNVGANANLFSVVDLAQMEMKAEIPAAEIINVAVGQRASLSVQGFAPGAIEAEVARISPVANAASGSVTVFLTVDNKDESIKGDLFATGEIVVATLPSAIGVPVAALRHDSEGDYVLKIAKAKLVRQPVTAGARWNNETQVQISKGAEVGDVIVSAPLVDLEAGSPAVVRS